MPSAKSYVKTIIIILVCVTICCIIILSLVPPVSKDALTHHLAVPKLYLKHGGIYEIPDILFSYYPMNLDLLYLIPLYFGNDIIPKFIHFSFALFTAGLVFFYLKRRINSLFAILGVLLFLSTPVIVKLSITVYVDLGLIFFTTASLLFLFKWAESRFKLKYLLISAVWCGLALGTKYNGLVTFFLLTLFVLLLYLRGARLYAGLEETQHSNEIKLSCINGKSSTQLKSVGYAALFFAASLIVFSPWMIRNYLWTNNPVYPLYNKVFNPPDAKSYPEIIKERVFESSPSQGSSNHFFLRSAVYKESWLQIVLIPIRIFFEGQDGTPQYFDGKLNPLLFFLPFFAFIGLKENSRIIRSEKIILSAFSILFILLVFFLIDMRIRWVLPAIPPLVILSMFGLNNIYAWIADLHAKRARKICTGTVSLIIVALVGLNVSYLLHQFRYVDPMSYISGRIGWDDYIERFRREYPAIQFANDNLPENARILCLFLGKRRYYSDRDMLFSEGLFLKAVRGSKSPEEVQAHLRQRKITHLLVRYDLFNKWQMDNFDTREKAVFADFYHDCVNLLFSKHNYGLFELKNM